MDRCATIDHARLFGGPERAGVEPKGISAKRPVRTGVLPPAR